MDEKICVINRKEVSIENAEKIAQATKTYVLVDTNSSSVAISGSNLEVVKLDPTNKIVIVSGEISGIKFVKKSTKSPLFKRIFK